MSKTSIVGPDSMPAARFPKSRSEQQRQAEEKAAVGIVVTAQGSRRPDLFAFARPVEIETEDRLPVEFGQYVESLAATGVMVRGGNPGGELPERSRTLLSRLGIDGQRWVETVVNYHRHFFSMVGHVHQIAIYCAARLAAGWPLAGGGAGVRRPAHAHASSVDRR